MKKFFLSLIILSVPTFGQTHTKSEHRSLFEDVVAANEQLTAAFNKQDADAMSAMYTQDAQLLPPNSQLVDGKEAIKDFWGAVFNMGFNKVILETIEVSGTGNTIYEVGSFTMYNNDEVFDNGKFMVVWKNVDSKWLLHRDIWNSNNPVQTGN